MTGRAFRLWLFSCVAAALMSATVLRADIRVARLDGRPEFKEGKALGYFVWRDGDTFKVRWTTFGAEHRFSGRIVLEGGELTSFKRIDVDQERKVVSPGRPARVVRGPNGRVRVRGGRGAVVASREEDHIEQETERLIRFSTQTNDDIDGLDFRVSNNTRELRFVLEIDGKTRPAEIEVGRSNFKPNDDPLEVELR